MKTYPTSRNLAAKSQSTRSLWKVLFLTLLGVLLSAGKVCAQETTWVSKDSDGNEGDSYSRGSSISADGRYVTFTSSSSNLVPNDANEYSDAFVHDCKTGETTRVSVDSEGNEGNEGGGGGSISADGRYVAYQSWASNLVSEDTNGHRDVFVHDRKTGETTRVSVDSEGNEGNGSSGDASISADGRYVAFQSWASNLVSEDTNGTPDIFVHDRKTGETTRVSVDSEGNETNDSSLRPSISADGRYVAFEAYASRWYVIFVHDRKTGKTTLVSVDSEGYYASDWSHSPSISADGRYVAFYSYADNLVLHDTNSRSDIFVHNRETGETTLVSVDSEGNQTNGWSYTPSISADGRYVAFYSNASNLVPEDTNWTHDVFVHDRKTGETIRVSVDSEGNEGNDASIAPSTSADGRSVAFHSWATNLVHEDTYSSYLSSEIYVHGPLIANPLEVSIDIAPYRDPNRIWPERGRLAVAILTDETFDATQVDPELVRFGPAEAQVMRDRIVDIDRDGDTDLVLYFKTEETGIVCGDTEATLTGETFEGVPITGTDAIVTLGCRYRRDN